MNLKNRVFGFKNKNLYIGELRYGITYRDNGITYDNDKLIKDSGIKNGTKIVLIQ